MFYNLNLIYVMKVKPSLSQEVRVNHKYTSPFQLIVRNGPPGVFDSDATKTSTFEWASR